MASQNVWHSRHERWRLHTLKTVFSATSRDHDCLEALAILESATLECKQRDINTPEVSEALDLLESYIWPKWLILQFRHNLDGEFVQIEFTEWTQDGHLGHSKFVGLRDDRGDRDLVGGFKYQGRSTSLCNLFAFKALG